MTAIIIFTILCIINVTVIFFSIDTEWNLIVILLLFFNYTLLLAAIDTYTSIPPIEVYRGNTTLQITYEGDTPIDSTVVWKNK